jgi:hypothetical protein
MICKNSKISDLDNVLGACLGCAKSEADIGRTWFAMVQRFLHSRPEEGERFEVVREVVESRTRPGTFLALESVGSTLVPTRLARAKRFDNEGSAREALGL